MTRLLIIEPSDTPPSEPSIAERIETPPAHMLEPYRCELATDRGRASQIAVIACGGCEAGIELLGAGTVVVQRLAKQRGWIFDQRGFGWLCPACALGLGKSGHK